MNISLEVSWMPFELGMPLDELLLSSYGFKKVGFLTRLFMPVPKKHGDVIFTAKNPPINMFGSAAQAGAALDSSMAAGMKRRTVCIIMYNSNKLRYVICQVVENDTPDRQFSTDIREAALKTLGEPTKTDGTQLWQEGDENFAFEIGSGGRSTVIHWWME
jgi:hypothetical protein